MNVFDTAPAQNLEAEKCVLASMLIDPATIPDVVELLEPESFARQGHQHVFAIIRDRHEADELTDAVILFNELKRRKQYVDGEIDHAYIHEIIDQTATTANAVYYAKIVREKALVRRVMGMAVRLAAKATANDGPATELLDEVERLVGDLQRSADSGPTSITLEAAALSYIDSLERQEIRFITSGIPELDECIDGAAPSNLVIAGARPSHGKSAFGVNWLDHAASLGISGLIISEEMAPRELGKRIVSRTAPLIEEDWAGSANVLRSAVRYHHESRAAIHIEGPCGTIDKAVRLINRHCERGVGIVMVDYIQLLAGKGHRKVDEIADVSRKLKLAARRNNCVVLALSQLNRESEGRDTNMPRMSDLRDSGAIEQDADLVILLQWPWALEYPHEQNARPEKHKYRIIVTKRRNGPIRSVDGSAPGRLVTRFDPDRQVIGSFAPVG
jgi:replicative DNA helicase